MDEAMKPEFPFTEKYVISPNERIISEKIVDSDNEIPGRIYRIYIYENEETA